MNDFKNCYRRHCRTNAQSNSSLMFKYKLLFSNLKIKKSPKVDESFEPYYIPVVCFGAVPMRGTATKTLQNLSLGRLTFNIQL